MNGGTERRPEPDVSRETSGLSDAEAQLKEILDRSMSNIPGFPEDDRQEEAPAQAEVPTNQEEPSTPSPEKGRRSSYVYLIVLLGAALLMLLAYFVQQRYKATAASRQELLDEIQRLERENESLKTQKNVIGDHLAQVKEEREELRRQIDQQYYTQNELHNRVAVKNALDYLERFISTGDWLMAGTIVERYDWRFNDQSPAYPRPDALPSQTARYLELREKVLEQGIISLEQISVPSGVNLGSAEETEKYFEQPRLRGSLFDEQDHQTASRLVSVFASYPVFPEDAACSIAYSFPDSGSLERLNSGAFRPSTVELFERVKADLIAAGALVEKDGTLAAPDPFLDGQPEDGANIIVYGEADVIITHPSPDGEF